MQVRCDVPREAGQPSSGRSGASFECDRAEQLGERCVALAASWFGRSVVVVAKRKIPRRLGPTWRIGTRSGLHDLDR